MASNIEKLSNLAAEVTELAKKEAEIKLENRKNEGIVSLHIDSSLIERGGEAKTPVETVKPEENEQSSKEKKTSESKNITYKGIKTHTIHLIDGEKGGAGKSFVSRAFIEYIQEKSLDFSIVDADSSNRDIEKIYTGCTEAYFSDNEKLHQEADKIFEMALKKSVLVNLPAQVYEKVTSWIDNNSLISLGQENGIRFIKWFICTGGHDSVQFFLKSLKHFDKDLTHVLVKNQGLCDDWKYVEELDEYQNAKNKHNFTVIEFPKLAHWEKNMVDRLQIDFTSATTHKELGVVSKQKVKNFLKEAYKAFDETGLVQ
ncbi:hypothetical protein RIVM261_076390 [Rivularia sp. IAM M-261]|nr:hypothetical protein RIVM261_076390 [Rivularia sp. IAM M-261]